MDAGESDLELNAKRRLGTVLRGKYRLDRLLGVGGMAVVYKATHRNQAEFAVKMLHPELSIREDVRTRFLREGYAANSVKHPGVVLVVDDDVAEDGAAFLVMEFLDGEGIESLWERSKGRVPVRGTISIAYQLLDVLAAAHAKGIVHRDIKPANLLATRDGTLKVLDFGIARARDAVAGSGSATGTGVLLGTPAFMAPEQAMGETRLIDGQTDVWAAGATMFSLLGGGFVHAGENAAQLMVFAATRPARPLASVAPDVPAAIAEVVDRALAFDKGARWPSAEAMRSALEAASRATYGEAPSKGALAAILRTNEEALAQTAQVEAPRGGAAGAQGLGGNAPEGLPSDANARAVTPGAPLGMADPGQITAQPVANTNASRVESSAKAKRGGLIALAFGGVVLLVGGVGLGMRYARHVADESSASPAPPPASAVQSADLVAPPTTSAVAPATPVASPSGASSAAGAPAEATLPAGATPSIGGGSSPAFGAGRGGRGGRGGAGGGGRGSPAKPRANCEPNYTYDAEGNKHFKRECF